MKLDEYDRGQLKHLIAHADGIIEFLAELQMKQVKELSKTTDIDTNYTVEEHIEREKWVDFSHDILESMLWIRSTIRKITAKELKDDDRYYV